jgi:ABC-2 type transport system permease protein
VVRARRIEREGIDLKVAGWLQESVLFKARKVDKRGSQVEISSVDTARQWAPMVFVYLLWVAIFTNSQALLTNTIEEKSTRVIEVLLSSVSPFELMAGKIAGMAASGLTVVGTWAICIGIGLAVVPGMLGGKDASFGGIIVDPLYLLSFLFYFLSGYLLYASLLVGIGSVCNSLKEAQNLMLPIMIPLMLPLMAMVLVSQDPNGTFARVMSFIPLFTPFVMMNRAAGPPPLWEYLATTVLMVVSVYLAVRGAGKVFRIGILMTGKPPRLREIVRWMVLKEGVNPSEGEGV